MIFIQKIEHRICKDTEPIRKNPVLSLNVNSKIPGSVLQGRGSSISYLKKGGY